MAAAAPLAAAAVAVEDRPGRGRCLVAQRMIRAGELVLDEAPLISSGRSDPLQLLRAFCDSPAPVQALVLDMFAPPLDTPAELVHIAGVQARQAKRSAVFAAQYDVAVLHRALVVFQLNAHAFGPGLALFAVGCRLNHACDANTEYTTQRVPGHGCHIAIQQIAAGQEVTTDYLGRASALPTTLRQQRLLREKLFTCSCPRCTGPDLVQAMPCPTCAAAVQQSPFPTEDVEAWASVPEPVPYAVADETGTVWQCAACGQEFCHEDVCPDAAGYALATARALHSLVFFGAPPGPPAEEVARAVATACRTVGPAHWATALLLDLHCYWLAARAVADDAHEADAAAAAIGRQWAAAGRLLWQFCAAANVSPNLFQRAFLADAEVMAQRGWLAAEVVPAVALRALWSHVMDVRRTALRMEDLPSVCHALGLEDWPAAARRWRSVALEALQGGRGQESAAWLRAAAVVDFRTEN